MRAMFCKGWSGLGSESQKIQNIHIIDDVPHDWLLSGVSAVIYHGGAGTTSMALKHDRPAVVISFYEDNVFWGDRIGDMRTIAKALMTGGVQKIEASSKKRAMSEHQTETMEQRTDSLKLPVIEVLLAFITDILRGMSVDSPRQPKSLQDTFRLLKSISTFIFASRIHVRSLQPDRLSPLRLGKPVQG